MHRHTRMAANLAALATGMLCMAYASVPLYRLFCDMTGYGGTTRQARAAPGAVPGSRSLTVTFNADVDPALPWRFAPAQERVSLRIGEQTLVQYHSENLTGKPLTGRATYNVTPFAAGQYFSKVECFCFTEQTLAPHQKVDMPVLFYIDPAILADPDLKNIQTITLSYTFFPVNTETSTK